VLTASGIAQKYGLSANRLWWEAALLYCCILPGAHRFFRSASYCSELLTKNLAVSYPKIIRVSVHPHGVPLTGHIDCMSAH
jgi:hypothetical protein